MTIIWMALEHELVRMRYVLLPFIRLMVVLRRTSMFETALNRTFLDIHTGLVAVSCHSLEPLLEVSQALRHTNINDLCKA